MLKKLFMKKEIKEVSHPCLEFEWAMGFVKRALNDEGTNEDKIVILDFILNLIKEDLKTALLTSIFYNEESVTIDLPFPLVYENESGEQITLEFDKTLTREISLAQDCVLVVAWVKEGLIEQIKNIFNNGFGFEEKNHSAYYYPYIEICYVYNGTHSITSGIGHKKGVIKAEIREITPLFQHVYTDGRYWYNQHTKEKFKELWDFRIGVIFEVAKIKYLLENA